MIFLSHSSKDNAYLETLANALKGKRQKVWFDLHEIQPGDPIPRKMSKGLKSCDRLLVAWSCHAEASAHVWNEIDAFYMRKPDPGNMLFMRLDETPIPTLYAARSYFRSCGNAEGDAGIIKNGLMAKLKHK